AHGGQLAQSLRHQTGLQAHVAVAHFAVKLGLGDQGRDRIDHQHVDRPGGDQGGGDLKRLLAKVRLGNQEIVDIYSELASVDRVKRVLDHEARGHAGGFLRVGGHLQGNGRFAGRLRSKDLADASTGESSDSQGRVERNGPGGDYRHRNDRILRSEAQDGAFSELFFD